MLFILPTVIATMPFFVAAVPQPPKQGGTAVPLSRRLSKPLTNPDKTVNFDALDSHVASTRAKVLRNLDNFEKNTGAPHPSALQGVQKRASVGNNLYEHNGLWFGTISVSIPSRNFLVVYDTGSSDFFLPGPGCGQPCYGHHIYDPSTSETAVDLQRTFFLHYVSGESVSGQQYNDTVSISGLTATDQAVGVASWIPPSFHSVNFIADGIVGMAFASISRFGASPVFQTLVSQGQTDEPVFAFGFLPPGPQLYIGGTNPDMYTGDFSYVPVIENGFWRIIMDNILGNGEIISTNVPAVVDSGADLIHGLPADVAALYEAIGGTDSSDTYRPGYYTFPCNNVPKVNFTLGGTSFGISAEQFNLGAIFYGSPNCVGAIVATDAISSWIVGHSFLANVYTVFDVGNMRVGFATPVNT
ncbi:acid protease [Gyrodon lividus]|nr:acid protease [Gyrodon lividus]KAF9222253.1 acid protease [Gyrodon lividus]